MDWPTVWQTWYCLGRQGHPSVAVHPEVFERYLSLHRDAIREARLDGGTAAQAYLVAAALDGDNAAAAALLDIPAQDGRRLEDCLRRVAGRHCPQQADDVVAELLFRWYNGTPQNPTPVLSRWPPTGDFCRYWLITVKRLATAQARQSRATSTIPAGLDPAVDVAAMNVPRIAGLHEHEALFATARQFVECFVDRLAKARHAERKLCVVAIASQVPLDTKVRQKQIAELLNVSEPTITRDIRAVIAAQEACIASMELDEEPSQAWWWGDVRAISAEDARIKEAALALVPQGDVTAGLQ